MTLHAGKQIHKNLLNCTSCGYVHWHPLPDASTVAKYYEDDKFYAGDSPHSPPDWFSKEEQEHEQGYWQAYYDYLESFLAKDKPVVDYGCGTGRFIFHLASKGWEVYGVDPSALAQQWSPIRYRVLPNSNTLREIRGDNWGNVVLMLTLEHILNPEEWLREEVLPHLDGRLVVVVPSEWNPIQKLIMNPDNPWFVNKVHLNYFDAQSLRGLLERVGLRVVSESSSFPMEAAILLGYDYRGNDSRGRRVHQFRLRFEKWVGPKIYSIVYKRLHQWFGIGRELIFICEKVK